MKTAIVLTFSVLAQAIGNTCLSKGMKALSSSSDVSASLSPMILGQAMESPMIWLGTIFLILFFVLFAVVLTWADLSFVLPVSSFGYILNVAFARYFLGEPVSALRWAGTGLIILGVVLVSGSGKRKAGDVSQSANLLDGAS
jgi:drug/metabolite transporter (DMT)-like permease